MKLLIIGSQLSGKTTITKYLRKLTDVPVSEVDEEILKLNDDVWPTDNVYKDRVLIPQIYESMAGKEDIIFFINSVFPITLLQKFKENGFTIIHLKISREEIVKRNSYRIEHEGYEDALPWIDGQLKNHEKIKNAGYIDQEIDAMEQVETIANLLMKIR